MEGFVFFPCLHSLNIHFHGQVLSGTELWLTKAKCSSGRLQAFKTCSLLGSNKSNSGTALCCPTYASFDSHKQICTPQPVAGDCLGGFRAPVFRDILISRLDTEYSKYCRQWLYSSVTVMKLQPHKPIKQMTQSYVKRDNSILLMITTVFYYSFIKE